MTGPARATPFALPLTRPLLVAGVAVPARFGALVEIGDGCGEAAAWPDAVPPDQPSAAAWRTAIECAELDRHARAAGLPLAALLGGARRARVPLNALLAATTPEEAAGEALAWVARGFRCLKLKLAPRDPDGERRRLAAVRAAVGPAVALRADANAAWSVDDAIAALRALAELDLEYVEQPVADVAGLAAVRRAVPVPIAADESVRDADDVDAIVTAGAADVVVIKPAIIGLRASLEVARRAHAAGLAVTVTSALESSVGIAAAAQVAAAIAGPLRACGLATAGLLAGDIVEQPLQIVDGALLLPGAPGLGVTVDRAALARRQVAASYRLNGTMRSAAAAHSRRRSRGACRRMATRQRRRVGMGEAIDVVAPDPAPLGGAAHRHAATSAAATTAGMARSPVLRSLNDGSNWLALRAEVHGDRPALDYGPHALTFSALHARAAAAAARLDAAGVGRGNRVGLLLGDRLAFAVWLHGIAHRGAVAVLLGERLSAPEIERQLRAAPCTALVAEPDTEAVADALPAQLTGIHIRSGALGTEGSPAAPFDLAAPHTIVFTSGSTGTPKAVTLTAGNHFWSAIGSALALGVRDDDRWLACLPLHHVGGLAILMRGLVSAIPVRLHARFDANAVNDAIDDGGVTRVSLVPAMLQRVLAARGERRFPPSLRTVLLGGAPAPPALLRECARRGVPVTTTYGMTEAASQVAVAGRPLLGVALRVRRGGVDAATGEVGGIEIAGAVVSPGQLGADGWLATRDLGSLDASGRLTVLGRADDVIITGGENVHPREVEEALESHPAIAEACVFGVPDPTWGEIVAAWVRPLAGPAPDATALLAHARQRLATFKVPRRLTVVADFPRSPAGKILRRAVRAAAG